jgi:hypothetical protein
VPTKLEVARAIQRLLDALIHEPPTLSTSELVSSFNELLQQAKEQFRDSDTLRLIEPLGLEASVALIAVRLSIVKRTIEGELGRSAGSAG